jgi:hypothetical protein
MKSVRYAAVFLLLSASAGFSQVRTWVSPTGLDTNPCTREQPCRNFAAAITAVAAGGEVVALESAGYGPGTITKSVTIVAPAGVHAAIAPSSGVAITVSAADTDHVVLRNLYLNAQGAETGIDANTVAALYVESCVVSGFSTYGILFDPTTSGAQLYVSDTMIRRSDNFGIYMTGGTATRATIASVRLHQNLFAAVYVQLAEATIRESVASGGLDVGFRADFGSKVMIEKSISVSSSTGFYAQSGGLMTMTRCTASSNSNFGVLAQNDGTTIYVSDSTITGNATGVSVASGGVVTSRGNNTLQANTTNGSFTSTFTPN